jgi:hypothetical protein
VQRFGFGAWGLGLVFELWGSGFGVQVLGPRIQGLRFGVWGLGGRWQG